MKWEPPIRPAELTEKRIISAILQSHFPINSFLPGERELASQLGVTRSTLREALQRLARDGWIEIQHGKTTRVRNYWQEGNLRVLEAIVQQEQIPQNFVSNLLEIRCLLAPTYTALSVKKNPAKIQELLDSIQNLPDWAENFAHADWALHHALTVASGNPIFTLILNGFREFYPSMAKLYFNHSETRRHSSGFYRQLSQCVRCSDHEAAERLTRKVMAESLQLWQTLELDTGRSES